MRLGSGVRGNEKPVSAGLTDALQDDMCVRDPKQIVPNAGLDLRENLLAQCCVSLLFAYELSPVMTLDVASCGRLVRRPNPVQRYQLSARLQRLVCDPK